MTRSTTRPNSLPWIIRRYLWIVLCLSLPVALHAEPASGDKRFDIRWESLGSDGFPRLTGLVTVLEKDSEVLDLRPGSFRLFEDGVEQPSLVVTPENEGMDVILVVDTSGSMREALRRSTAAVRLFLKDLGTQDRAALIGFSDQPRVLQPLTSQFRLVDQALDRLKPDGGTALYDTLVTASSRLSPSLRRRVVVLLTDGCDQNAMGTGPGSRTTLDQAVESCRLAHAVVFGIGLGFQVDRKVLERVTGDTGGQAYWAAGADQLQDLYQRIMRDIRRRYRITYRTTNPFHDGSKRLVRIQIEHAGWFGEGTTTYWVDRDGSLTAASPIPRVPPIVTLPTRVPDHPTATETPTEMPAPPVETPTHTPVPPRPTETDSPTPSAVPASLALSWNGMALGTADLGQLAVFVEGEWVEPRRCQITLWADGTQPQAAFYLDRRAFLSPGRYRVRFQAPKGRLYEAQTVVRAGMLQKTALSPVRTP